MPNWCYNVVEIAGNKSDLKEIARRVSDANSFLEGLYPLLNDDGSSMDYDYDHWLVSPTPNQNYDFEVLYYERLQPIDSAYQTNWITQNAPNAMLFGTLLQAMPFLKNDQRQIFQQKYDQAMQVLKMEDQLRLGDRQAIAIES